MRREKEEIRERRRKRESACRGYPEKKNEIARKTKRRSRSKRREDVAEEERNGKLKFRRTQKTKTERRKRKEGNERMTKIRE